MSPSRTGPFTLRMMERVGSSKNSTRTWRPSNQTKNVGGGGCWVTPGVKTSRCMVENKSVYGVYGCYKDPAECSARMRGLVLWIEGFFFLYGR